MTRPRGRLRSLGLLALSLVFAAATEAESVPDPAETPAVLALDDDHEQRITLAAGGARTFELRTAIGDFLHVEVHEETIDVVAALMRPSGDVAIEVDLAHGPGRPERILWVTEEAGAHRLELRARRGSVESGTVRLRIDASRPASEKERSNAAAYATSARGYSAFRLGTREGLLEALEQFERALGLWNEIGDESSLLDTQSMLARVLGRLGEHERADDHTASALEIAHRLGRTRVVGVLTNNRAASLLDRGRYEEAVDAFLEAVRLAKEAGNPRGEAYGLLNAGSTLDRIGQPWRALELYERAAPIAEATPDARLRIALLQRVGTSKLHAGDMAEARSMFEEALALAEGGDLRREKANLLTNLGRLHLDLGDLARARALLTESLDAWTALGEARGEFEARRSMARLAREAGESRAAEDGLRTVERMCIELESDACAASALTDLGALYLETDRVASAVETLTAARDRWPPAEGGRLEAGTLAMLGRAQRRLGTDPSLARRTLEEALGQARSTRHWSVEVMALGELGELALDRGRPGAAVDHLTEAVRILESLRARMASPTLRATFLGSHRSHAIRLIDALVAAETDGASGARGGAEQALEIAEAIRARDLLDRLRELGQETRSGVPPALLEAENDLRRRITLLDHRRLRQGLNGGPDARAREALETALDEALAALDDVVSKIREAAPEGSGVRQATPLDESAIRALLDPDTVVIAWTLGDRASYLFRISAESTTLHPIAGEAALRADAEAFRALAEASRGRLTKVPFERAAAKLSQSLLGAVASQLDVDRLVFVPDGLLSSVPFAALPHPSSHRRKSARRLIERSEIVVLPSASALGYLRDLGSRARASTKKAAILADPVFDRRDARLGGEGALAETHGATGGAIEGPRSDALGAAMRTAARRAGIDDLARLPHTSREAEELRGLLVEGDLLEATGFDAAKQTLLRQDLARYEVLHFATHAFIDDLRPDLSGIVLSLVDAEGREIDGVLRLHEIYGLDVASRLVVLSACQTALGREVRGEGPLGLARGFLYAGAESVVATLWQVEDAASATLISRFYRALAEPGARPAQALRAAQLSMARDPAWSAPYYWAGFSYQGDWRRVPELRFLRR